MCNMLLKVLFVMIATIAIENRAEISTDMPSIYYTEPSISMDNDTTNLNEIPGGYILSGGIRLFERSRSPYILREDLFVENGGELIIEPGVEIRFAPMIGITVRGIIKAQGEPEAQITLTSIDNLSPGQVNSPKIRLVDGQTPLDGRLQLFHQGTWRSVCTNSRNWTRADYETTCRALGFQGGKWAGWLERLWPANPRLLYEEPLCRGVESSLQECLQWSTRKLGAGACDYHPDIAISCLPLHDGQAEQAIKHWRGIKFEGAIFDRPLIQENTLYIRRSKSILRHVNIKYAGTGRENNVTSALEVEGVPPQMEWISVLHSAYTGINITKPESPVVITNSTIRNNRGYGIYVNSSIGMAHIDNCVVIDNAADGIKYVHHDARPDDQLDRANILDFCTYPITSQTFPLIITMEQTKYSFHSRNCSKYVYAPAGHILTVQFLKMETDRNDSATIEIYDGVNTNGKLLAHVDVRNGTMYQSITTTRQHLYIKFEAQPQTQMVAFLRVVSGYNKIYDLNVTNSAIADNNGRGIVVEGLRSLLHVHDTSVTNNNHVSGIHVLNGVPDVNITSSRISFNSGAGINITVTGGNRNISRSTISSNRGYGLAVWLNTSSSSDYVHFNQTTVVEYSEIFRNKDIGVLIGNSTGISYVNITGNCFNTSDNTAVQIESSWRSTGDLLKLQIGHNVFMENFRLGVKLNPALNVIGKIEYNHFRDNLYGGLLIRNPLYEEFNILPVNIIVQYNEFYQNKGVFVVNIGLSPYSDVQQLIFTRNFLRDNIIKEPFDNQDTMNQGTTLIPRSRVAAVIVVSSSNVHVFRNILQNHQSQYEIGSHLEDQSKEINCTYNWLGFKDEDKIYERLFYRKDRYNLAKIIYLPYLRHNSNPAANTITSEGLFVPSFQRLGTKFVGGEVDGDEKLLPGEYIVERDINIRPSGKLLIHPGVTLRFPPAVGMMVAGKLDARGNGLNNILMTLKEEIVETDDDGENNNDNNNNNNEDGDIVEPGSSSIIDKSENGMVVVASPSSSPSLPVRLLGGRTNREGRLQIQIDNKWGTVCNYGWTMRDAALVCHQLGLTLDPDEWNMERTQIPQAGINEDIIVSNVQCTEDDTVISQCKAEYLGDFENSCTHDNDVGIKCSEPAWAGLRLGPLADRTDLQFITIEKAGLLDYTTNSFKPALQIDFSRHSLEGIKIMNNIQDGLGILYSDIYSANAINTVKNSDFSNNKGSGISFKQLGLRILNSRIENNKVAGIRHNPALSAIKQREFAGWFMPSSSSSNTADISYNPIIISETISDINLSPDNIKYLITVKRSNTTNVKYTIQIRCEPRNVIGIQLLNPIENRSTERIIIYDSQRVWMNNQKINVWNVKRDLSVFPVSSTSFSAILEYESGTNALGGVVLVLTALPAPVQDIRNRIVTGPIPTLFISKTKIKNNKCGILASYYNRYNDELANHYFRKANESIKLVNCEISHNQEEAIYINSPDWNFSESNISEITIHINKTLITDNGKGIVQFSRNMRQSNNLFHWIIQDSSIERNNGGGLDLSLSYVWQYNENFTHSLYFGNNTWRNNQMFHFIVDGHYAALNMSYNVFDKNYCKNGLISIRGMEKKMKFNHNRIENNSGTYMVEFKVDSQSEIFGEISAIFHYNEIKNNFYNTLTRDIKYESKYNLRPTTRTYVVGFHGIQKVNINRNLFGNNLLDYELSAGIITAKIDNQVDVKENWWGTSDETKIKMRIFDFDDWNNHALANFKPYLTSDSFDSSISASWEVRPTIDVDNLGGRIVENLSLPARSTPYIIRSDITIMPEATVNIDPDVIMEFAPNVGILVLGTLNAKGVPGHEIIMRPIYNDNIKKIPEVISTINTDKIIDDRRTMNNENIEQHTIRLCKDGKCSSSEFNEGFVEFYNRTTLQWIPLCDLRFTERNAQVACRQLGYDPLNVYVSHNRRYELHRGSLTYIWSWPEPIQCSGYEERLEDCQIRLNGQLFGHKYDCPWDGNYVFIHCGERNLNSAYEYWGGIRIANSDFEHHLYEYRIHDVVTHQNVRRIESVLQFINITGAGILHNEKSPAIQSVTKSPAVTHVSINQCAYHGINIVSPVHTVELLFNNINNVLGNGVNVISLTGEGRETGESSFSPLKDLNIPYHLFSMIDMCDPAKEIIIEERVLIYYKYDNNPVNCVKIFHSTYHVKPFGFRLLQFNLFNSTQSLGRPDGITLYDGEIYNVTAKKIGHLEFGSTHDKELFKTKGPSISIRLFANGASNLHGFIAEVVTLPISAIGFNRDVQHNISYSKMSECQEGAIKYINVGELNAIATLERNQFINNCHKFYGNFSTCKAAVELDVQNTQLIYFRNNLLQHNQGGLSIRSDSRGSATSLKGWVHNNLFTENLNKPTLYIEGRQSSPYQEVTIYRNYFVNNYAPYENNIILNQVVSNMTLNYLHANLGLHLLEISGFERVRLPIYQTTSHNGFYKNYAIDRNGRSTIVAGTPGQQYVDNVFFNPNNDYEILTINRSSHFEMWRSHIDARYNWWGYNETLAVGGRVRDRGDSPELLQVDYQPFHMNNKSVLNGKCPPSWDLVGDTCYIYIGAPMDFYSARDFCRMANASMPFIMGDYLGLWRFLRKQQEHFQYFDRVWIQQLERIDQCTTFTYQTIEIDECSQPSPFICEIDPRIRIDPLSWRKDVVAVSVLGAISVAIILLAVAIGFWISKSKKRKVERLERRNSIRQSLHSLRSIGSTSGFTELAYRRKPLAGTTTKSTDTLTSRSMDYKKMMSGGSIDSMDKSQLNSSIEDNQSYDVYEAHNPRYSPASTSDFKGNAKKYSVTANPNIPHADNPIFDLAYRNDGFRNHSTFTSRANSNWQSMANSEVAPEDTPVPDPINESGYLNNASTLPLNSSLTMTDSITELKRDIDTMPAYSSIDYENYGAPTTPASEPVPVYFNTPLPPQTYYYYEERPRSGTLLETNFDNASEEKPLRSKSETLLETNFDVFLPHEPTELTQLSAESRSKSQPLETAM